MKLEVQIGVSSELIEQLDAGRLDVVFAKRPLGTSKRRLAWREPLVWAASRTFDLSPGAALPLALYREHSVSRDAALLALRDSDVSWQIVYTSPSLTGVRAAALAGLAITPLPASVVTAGLRALGAESGLPVLSDLEFAIFEKRQAERRRGCTGDRATFAGPDGGQTDRGRQLTGHADGDCHITFTRPSYRSRTALAGVLGRHHDQR